MIALLALLLGSARAEGPQEPWFIVETAHYRLHSPVAAEDWALHLAGRLEEIRSRVSAEVGHSPQERVDIVVMDPLGLPNGFAIPLGRHPRMGVFPVAPGASAGLGWYRDWAEDLVVHEDAHLAHLLRPSRNGGYRATLGLFGLDPITTKSPRWVIEGYATVVEGRLTGMGRPHSDARAAWLRVLAQDGRLPPYEALANSGAWMGRSHAYLVGSAFLEWLERRRCPGQDPAVALQAGACRALPDLWARLSARKARSFRVAFEGVFGAPPAELYARFRAELEHEALAAEGPRQAPWLDLDETTLSPALSPDGARIAAVRRVGDQDQLLVWSTAEDPEAQEDWWRPHREALEKDPQDVLPLPPASWPREPVATRANPFRAARDPRWMPDGQAILFAAWEQGPDGSLRPELFTWAPDTGQERRVTRGAGLSQPDPHPDGTWAVAHQQVWGRHRLVRVELASGAVSTLVEAPIPQVLDQPRLSPDGQRLLYLRHEGRWSLVVRQLADGAEQVYEAPGGALFADPAWAPDGRGVFLSLGQGGALQVARLDLETQALQLWTAARGAALAPVPGPDGVLYHLDLDSDGVDLQRIVGPQSPRGIASRPPIVPPVHPGPPPPLAAAPVPEARPYRLGRLELFPLAGGGFRPSGGQAELGLRLGDLVGRHELILLGGYGGDVEGGSAAWTWRGPGLGAGGELTLQPFLLREDGGEWQGGEWQGGGELRLGAERQGRRAWSWMAGAWGRPDAQALFGDLGLSPRVGRGAWLGLDLGLHGEGRLQDGALLPLGEGRAALGLGIKDLGLWLRGEAGHAEGGWRIGGMDSGLLPLGASAERVVAPSLAPAGMVGDERIMGEAELGLPGFGLVLHSERLPQEGLAQTWWGLRTATQMPAVALARTPGLSFEAAFGCVVEAPGSGWDAEPCRQWGDWTGWVGVVMGR